MLHNDPELDREVRAENRKSPMRWRTLLLATAVVLFILIAIGLLASPPAASVADEEPAVAGVFSPAGSLGEGRNGHTATLLADGRVLIAGGGREDAPKSADAWDPARDAFEPGGSLLRRRKSHTATLLSDGRVLLVGGSRATAKTEVWDPTAGSSEASGPLAIGRNGHSATRLDDGRVLVVGGWMRPGWLTSAEVWDPATGSFGTTGSLDRARMSHTATLLLDGRVLIIGGHGADQYAADAAGNLLYPDEPRALAEVWDPDTGTFSPAGALAEARSQHAAALLSDGRVLVVGGWGHHGDPALAEVWDPTNASFSPAGWLDAPGPTNTATALPDDRVFVVGETTAELWDSALSSFVPAGSLTQARWPHTATLLDDGRVLIVGGHGRAARSTADLWESRALTDEQARELAEDSSVCGELREAFMRDGTTGDPARDEEYMRRCLSCEELFAAFQFLRTADLELSVDIYREHCDPDWPPLPRLAPSPASD